MNLLIFGANWHNRGDESAVRAMIDEIRIAIPKCNIKIHFNQLVDHIPYDDIAILKPFKRCAGRNKLKVALYKLSLKTNGKVPYPDNNSANAFYEFLHAVRWADYVIYAPGGPCIGDYYHARELLLDMLDLIIKNRKPFSLFAPSVGPFTYSVKRIKRTLEHADIICFREEISQKYFHDICPHKKTTVTLDSAFQHSINLDENLKLYNTYKDLHDFIAQNKKIIGITITNLQWHRNYKNDSWAKIIEDGFSQFISYLLEHDFGVLFIPQLFGKDNDKIYMSTFVKGENCYVMSDEYDCYFQQYIIAKLFAVVGMRYHSNIFSAKMGTPFISVSYEKKMQGFMQKAELSQYCLLINDLTFEALKSKFELMLDNYNEYKDDLDRKKETFKEMSYKTTELVSGSIKSLMERCHTSCSL